METLLESGDLSLGRPHVDVCRRLVHGWLYLFYPFLYCFHYFMSIFSLQVELSPGSLKWPAIYGLTQSLAVVFSGSVIGRWVDRTPRWNGSMHDSYSFDKRSITFFFYFLI